MSLTLYAHPFAAYCWKVLIALYENATPFGYRVVEDAEGWAELEALWPIKKFPLLRDGGKTIVESSVIVEYLMLHHPGSAPMIPASADAALEVRFMDRFFDNYVMTPMQTLVSDRMRTEKERDAKGVAVRAKCWTWHMRGWRRESHQKPGCAVGFRWRSVPPPRHCFMPIGSIRLATASRAFVPSAAGFCPGPPSPAWSMRRVHTASSFPKERRSETDRRGQTGGC